MITKEETDINKIIDEIFENLKKEERGFSNEAQMQHELAVRFRDYEIIDDVELEELSSNLTFEKFNEKESSKLNDKNKYYTDLVLKVKNGEKFEYVVIELKFKTPDYNVNIVKHTTKNKKNVFYTFKQGAEDEGSYLFWKDVERLEKFNDEISPMLLNFDNNKKVVKKFVILMTNAPKYWTGVDKSLCSNFFPKNDLLFWGDLCWKIKLYKKYRVSGKASMKINGVKEVELKYEGHKKYEKYYKIEDIDGGNIDDEHAKFKPIIPIRLKGEYKCVWKDYIGVACDPNLDEKYNNFRYLVLEVGGEKEEN